MLVYSWQLTPGRAPGDPAAARRAGSCRPGSRRPTTCVRTRVGEMLSEVSESRDGRRRGARLRPGGADRHARVKRRDPPPLPARDARAPARRHAVPDRRRCSGAAGAGSVVVVVGVDVRPAAGGSRSGDVAAFLFLADLFLDPFTDLPEIYARRRRRSRDGARSWRCWTCRWRSSEPAPGVALPRRRPSGRADGVRFAYRAAAGGAARHRRCDVPAGAHVAIVGRDRMRQDDVREAADAGSPIPSRARSGSEAWTCATSRPPSRRRADPDGAAGRVPVRRHHARRTSGSGGGRDRRATSMTAFEELGLGGWVAVAARRAATRASASGARRSRSASASSWRWRGRRSAIPGC